MSKISLALVSLLLQSSLKVRLAWFLSLLTNIKALPDLIAEWSMISWEETMALKGTQERIQNTDTQRERER